MFTKKKIKKLRGKVYASPHLYIAQHTHSSIGNP